MTDNDGNYSFQSILPVPCDEGGGLIHPAHFHLIVTDEGYQSLVTQLFSQGNKNVASDPWASRSYNRVLEVRALTNGTSQVIYNVGMASKLAIEPASLKKLVGLYQNKGNPERILALFEYEISLWVKNEAFGNQFSYLGNNVFKNPNHHEGMNVFMTFEFPASGAIQVSIASENFTPNTFIKQS